MICYYCHHGWPEKICEIYEKYEKIAGYNLMLYGPAHVVWEDENFDSWESCLKDFDKFDFDDYVTKEQKEAVRQSLIELSNLDDSFFGWPEDYDGENPAMFPPPPELKFRKPVYSE